MKKGTKSINTAITQYMYFVDLMYVYYNYTTTSYSNNLYTNSNFYG